MMIRLWLACPALLLRALILGKVSCHGMSSPTERPRHLRDDSPDQHPRALSSPTLEALETDPLQLNFQMTVAPWENLGETHPIKLHFDSWITKKLWDNVCCFNPIMFWGNFWNSDRKSIRLNSFVKGNSLVTRTPSNCITSWKTLIVCWEIQPFYFKLNSMAT